MPGIRMIADDQRKIASQLASAMAVKKIHQAVVVSGDKNRHSRTAAGQRDAPVHSKLVGDRTKSGIELVQVQLKPAKVPFDACVIEALLSGRMLFEIEDIAVVP